jgi:predicted ATP-grasp superfamily ATP-dependent carboligase/CelD/BcsL family acetyltransferase involved in cellulose biosynthesis
MKVLITDGDNRAALAVVRSLGRAGHQVVVGERRMPALAQSSRYCRQRFVYPDPVSAPDAFVEHLVDYAHSHAIEALLPISDITTFLTTRNRDRFPVTCGIPFASADTLERAADKVDMLQTASRLGLPVPRSIVIKTPAEVADTTLEFPLVIKPWRSRILTAEGWASTAVSYAADLEQLQRDLAGRPAHEFPVMLQERITGSGAGVFACYDHGKAVALFSHRRLRERPPWGGVSVLSESVALPPRATAYATRLLDEIGWHGIAMVEFKEDVRDGEPKLMEINGRFWGSLQLAIDAGVDFPRLLLQTLGSTGFPPPPAYKIGIKSRWLWGDLDSLMLTYRGRPAGAATGGEDARRLPATLSFLKFWGSGLHYDNPKWHDPRPGMFETYHRLVKGAKAAASSPADRKPALARAAGALGNAAAIHRSGLRVSLASCPETTGLDEASWNALASQSETNSIFQTHEWSKSWWQSFHDQHESMLLTVNDGSRTVGVAPLVLGRRASGDGVVHFLSDNRADYCDILAAGDKARVLRAVVDTLGDDKRWHLLDLSNIPMASQTVPLLKDICQRAGYHVIAEEQYRCPSLLIAGHEAAAKAIANKESLRRRENYFRKAGNLVCRNLTEAAEIEPMLDAFFSQHIARWQASSSPSLFEQARNRDFYRKLTHNIAPAGWLAFAVIEFDGRPIAFHYGFDYNGALLWYKPSFEPKLASHSPGMVLVRHLIQSAIANGRRELDFTVGDEQFKKRFTNIVRTTSQVLVFRDKSRYLLERSKRRLSTSLKRLSA